MIGIVQADARRLPLASNSIDCVITSPPYNMGMTYDGVRDDWPVHGFPEDSYGGMVAHATLEIARVLKPGGRAWINIAPTAPLVGPLTNGSTSHRSELDDGERWSPSDEWGRGLRLAGMRYRDTVVWDQIAYDAPTAWGSYLSPNAPNLKGRHEVILLFFKERWPRGRVGHNEIDKDSWCHWTRNVWSIPTRRQDGWHPCPFPPEIPKRAILLSTWRDDLVLDPFMGSGTTLQVAHELGRRAIGADLSGAYCRRVVDVGFQGGFDFESPATGPQLLETAAL